MSLPSSNGVCGFHHQHCISLSGKVALGPPMCMHDHGDGEHIKPEQSEHLALYFLTVNYVMGDG